MKAFEVGKRYETAVPDYYLAGGLKDIGQQFTCHAVDGDGDCWSMDIVYNGKRLCDGEGWCCAKAGDLNIGAIVECKP